MSFPHLQWAGSALCGGARGSHCGDLSYCGAWPPGSWASEIAAHRLTSCGIRACGIFLGPGIKPMSPASAGRFLTNGPPGKSSKLCVFFSLYIVSYPYKWWQVEHPVAIPARICILLHLSSFLGTVLWWLWWRWIVSFGISLVPFQYPSHSSAASAYCPIHPPAIFSCQTHMLPPRLFICLTGHVLS